MIAGGHFASSVVLISHKPIRLQLYDFHVMLLHPIVKQYYMYVVQGRNQNTIESRDYAPLVHKPSPPPAFLAQVPA